MTTRELIEAVLEPKQRYYRGPYSEELASSLYPAVPRRDYDALRAACAAVLDEVIEATASEATWRQVFDARVNARALRERMKG